jgi:hypothetical protein
MGQPEMMKLARDRSNQLMGKPFRYDALARSVNYALARGARCVGAANGKVVRVAQIHDAMTRRTQIDWRTIWTRQAPLERNPAMGRATRRRLPPLPRCHVAHHVLIRR